MAVAVEDRYLPKELQKSRRTDFRKWFKQNANAELRCYEEPWQWQHAGDWSKLKTFLSSASNFVDLINHRSKQEVLTYWQNIEVHTKTRLTQRAHVWHKNG